MTLETGDLVQWDRGYGTQIGYITQLHPLHLVIDNIQVIAWEDVVKKIPTDTKEDSLDQVDLATAYTSYLNDSSLLDDVKGGQSIGGSIQLTGRAKKDDVVDRKPHVYYTHSSLEEGLANAQEAGAMKYGQWNYLAGHTSLQLLSAAKRHLTAFIEGEDLDQDCTDRLGKPVSHLDCVLANLNMLYTQRAIGVLKDDRGPKRRKK